MRYGIGVSNRSVVKLDQGVRGLLGVPRRSVAMLTNSTCIGYLVEAANRKYDLMYAKRAFVHYWLGEGIEGGEMSECREDCAALEKDYENVAMENNPDDVSDGY